MHWACRRSARSCADLVDRRGGRLLALRGTGAGDHKASLLQHLSLLSMRQGHVMLEYTGLGLLEPCTRAGLEIDRLGRRYERAQVSRCCTDLGNRESCWELLAMHTLPRAEPGLAETTSLHLQWWNGYVVTSGSRGQATLALLLNPTHTVVLDPHPCPPFA